MKWDFSTIGSQRKAHGSDLWPCTWARDDRLYCAWGDGGGFDGDSDTVGRVSLGFARIEGTPSTRDPDSYTGRNVWGDAPAYAQHPATFGGKVASIIAVDGALYAYGALWTKEETPDPVHRSNQGPEQRLIRSADFGATWQIAPWQATLGSFLNFGRDNFGALDEFVYVYYLHPQDDTRVYLKRIPQARLMEDPEQSGVCQYLTGIDERGNPRSWSGSAADAAAVFIDPNGADVQVVYDAALGRFLLTSGHNPGGSLQSASAGQWGLFEAPHPWGPWATVGYYDTWAELGSATRGDYLGVILPSKWISRDGRTLWAVFSSMGQYDSFNTVRATLSVVRSAPRITSPAAGTSLIAGSIVTMRGAGSGLSWSAGLLAEGAAALASGRGHAFRLAVPTAAVGQTLRVTLEGSRGRVYRDYRVGAAPHS
ncbi:MAG TPA: hypothetical protein VIY54_01510 [Steroidobacteraceae bacterium]